MYSYLVEKYNKEEYTFDFYVNDPKKLLSWRQILENDPTIYGIVNLGYFSLLDGSLQSNTKYHGEWIYGPSYQDYGLAINESGNLFMSINEFNNDTLYSYTAGCPPLLINGINSPNRTDFAANGITIFGFDQEDNPVILVEGKDTGLDTVNACKILTEVYNCKHIIRMDGSWSTQGRLSPCSIVQPSEERKDRIYLIIRKNGWTNPFRTNKKAAIHYNKNTEPDRMGINFIEQLPSLFLQQQIESFMVPFDLVRESKLTDLKKSKMCNLLNTGFFLDIYFEDNLDANVVITTSSAGVATRNTVADYIQELCIASEITTKRQYNRTTLLSKTNAPACQVILSRTLDNDTILHIFDLIAHAITIKGFDLEYIEPVIEKSNFDKLKDMGYIPQDAKEEDTLTWNDLADVLILLINGLDNS